MPSVTVGTTPVDVLGPNARRKTLTVRNASTGGQIIYFWLQSAGGLTTTNADYVFNVGEEKSFILFFDGPDMQNAIAAVADGAGGTFYYTETAERGPLGE